MLTTHPFDDDHLHEECGIFGIFGDEEAAAHTVLGLHALQHRGQEAAGIVTFDGQQFHAHRAHGPGRRQFRRSSPSSRKLTGHAAIGHNRYSTTGETIAAQRPAAVRRFRISAASPSATTAT